MNVPIISGIVGITATLGSGVWWVAKEVPTKEQLQVVELKVEAQNAKTNHLYDIQMEGQIERIKNLQNRKNKSRDEIDQLHYMRKQLDDQRKMRDMK